MLRMPQPIPYQGSKRQIAECILNFAPPTVGRLVEPFVGSAALSIAAAYRGIARRFLLNDLNKPLTDLLQLIINKPEKIIASYAELWNDQLGREREFYDEIRTQFNQTQCPALFLYLLARCVKASVRYNANGEFNQAPDNRRKGRHPASMHQEIIGVSQLLQGKAEVICGDFRQTLDLIDPMTDFVYLDPPYQGTSGTRDARYCSGVQFTELAKYLEQLNQRHVMFALSYDGIKGDKVYGSELPTSLGLHKIVLEAGRSTQSTLLGKSDITYESLYLSPTLITKLGLATSWIPVDKLRPTKTQPIFAQQMAFELPLT